MPIRTVNPATGEQLREFSSLGAADIERTLARAAEAREKWSRARVAERARVVRRAGELLDERKERYGRLMTLEMGKTLRSAIEESAKCATGCRYYAQHAEEFLGDELVASFVDRLDLDLAHRRRGQRVEIAHARHDLPLAVPKRPTHGVGGEGLEVRGG